MEQLLISHSLQFRRLNIFSRGTYFTRFYQLAFGDSCLIVSARHWQSLTPFANWHMKFHILNWHFRNAYVSDSETLWPAWQKHFVIFPLFICLLVVELLTFMWAINLNIKNRMKFACGWKIQLNLFEWLNKWKYEELIFSRDL